MRRNRTTTISLNRTFAVLLAALLVIVIGVVSSYRVQANYALRQAKNVSLSLKLLNIYGQAEGYSVYDPTRESGLTEQAEAGLESLISVKGTVVLVRWNPIAHVPLEFTYDYKQCSVTYRVSESSVGEWTVDYRLPILRYG